MEPMRKDLLIRGEQIYLRPITADDTELAVRWRNKPTVVENFIYRKPLSRADHEKWLAEKFSGDWYISLLYAQMRMTCRLVPSICRILRRGTKGQSPVSIWVRITHTEKGSGQRR